MAKIISRSTVLFLSFLVLFGAGCERPAKEEGPQVQQTGVAAVGRMAPDFTLQDTSGKTWKLSELRGQVVFVNFWATWCPPCREEMPSMQELYTAMPKGTFKMLTILSNDDPNLALAFVEKVGCTFPILVDPFSKIGQAYGLTGVPETYIVDKQGVLRQKYLGPRNWNSPEARAMLLRYVNQ